jgi:hypothetical protein
VYLPLSEPVHRGPIRDKRVEKLEHAFSEPVAMLRNDRAERISRAPSLIEAVCILPFD